MKRFPRVFSLAALMVMLTCPLAGAQATAELAGRVTDDSGAVLPGVSVTATQTDTGFTRSVVTDGSGAWVITNLPTGPYKLEVALQGFKTYVQTGIVLQVGATPTINAVLGVGNLEETVAVEAAAPIVDVTSTTTGGVLDSDMLTEILQADDDVERAAHALVDAALEQGGRDNVTALVVRYEAGQ